MFLQFSTASESSWVLGSVLHVDEIDHFTESDYFLASEFGKTGKDWGFHPGCARSSPEQVAFFLLLWFT